MNKLSASLIIAAATFGGFAASAEGVVTGDNGMTLYTFDKDSAGTSTCYDDCAKNWPPYAAMDAAKKMPEGWTMIDRTDGTKQWAYDGKPTYFYVGDKKAGDTTGDGKGEVWHVLTD